MRIGLLNAYFRGWGLALAHPVVLVLKWLVNLGCALLIVVPLHDMLRSELDHRALAKDLLTRIDSAFFSELVGANAAQISEHAGYWLGLLVIFGILNLYLTGGILEVLQRERGLGLGGFFRACGRQFPALLFILVCTVIFFFVMVGIPLFLWERVFTFLEDQWPDQGFLFPTYWFGLLLIGLLCVTWTARVYDYARIAVCRPDHDAGGFLAHSLGSFFGSLGFTLMHYWRSLGLWLLFLATQVVLIPLFSRLSAWFGPADLAALETAGFNRALLVSLILGQVLIFLRITVGIASLAGQMRFWQGYTEAPRSRTTAPPPAREQPEEAADPALAETVYTKPPPRETEPESSV